MSEQATVHGQLQMDALLGRYEGASEQPDALRLARRDAEDANLPTQVQGKAASGVRLKHPMSARIIDPKANMEALRHFLGENDKRRAAEFAPREPSVTTINQLWMDLAHDETAQQIPASDVLPDHSVVAYRSLAAGLIGARRNNGQAALLYLHVGPVQSFITASRRTSDLFVSSYCIAYLTMQAIKEIVRTEGLPAIVVPWLADIPLAEKEWNPKASGTQLLLRSSLPNKVLAVVPLGEAKDIAERAANAVRAEWKTIAEKVWKELDKHANGSTWDSRWAEQIDHHLEIDTIVQPWPKTRQGAANLLEHVGLSKEHKTVFEANEEIEQDRTGAEMGALYDLTHRVMAAHRNTYGGEGTGGNHRPKCALCAQREQMGPVTDVPKEQETATRKFFVALHEKIAGSVDSGGGFQFTEGEGLCAVCLTKRFALRCYFAPDVQYPNIPAIAAAPFRWWVLMHEYKRKPEALRSAYTLGETIGKLVPPNPGNWLPQLGPMGQTDPWRSLDGQWLYDSGYDPKVAWSNFFGGDPETLMNRELFKKLQNGLPTPRARLETICRNVDAKPSSYYAVLMIDGDDMGDWLTGRHKNLPTLGDINGTLPPSLLQRKRPLGPAIQGEFSRRTSALAIALYKIVEEHFLGRVVFSGGDDFLAFLPLATVLPCLQEIRTMARSDDFLGDKFTLSAGIAVHHMRNPLREALRHARDAEKKAKRDKNGFALKLALRSGGESEIVLPFQIAGVDVIPSILDLLPWKGDEENAQHPLRSVNTAFRLDDELQVLKELIDDKKQPVAGPFRSRLRKLLGAGFVDNSPLLGEKSELTMQTKVDVLHLVRFLLREEKGIETAKLLEQLERGPLS